MEKITFGERLRRRRPYIATFMATLALSASLEMGTETGAKSPKVDEAPAAAASFEPLDDFEDLEIHLLSDPNAKLPQKYSSQEVRSTFTSAGLDITSSTDGAFSLPDTIPVHTIDASPLSDTDELFEGKACYTTNELFDLGKSLRKTPKQDIAIIVNETAACKQGNAAAWAYVNENITVYPFIDERIVAHELGHTRKLGHHAVIGCRDSEYGGFEVDKPLSVMMEDPNCRAVKNDEGEVDEYHSWHSVMGGGARRYKEVYHPLELEKLDPENFKVLEVAPEERVISIAAVDSGVRGIKFRLPKGHSLQKADPEMDFVSITAMRQRDYEDSPPQADVVVTSSGKKMLYDIIAFSLPTLTLSQHGIGRLFDINEVYVDQELGIRVTAMPDMKDPEKISLYVSELKK